MRYVELLLRKLLLTRKVRVRLLGDGRVVQLTCMLQLELLFSRCWKFGRLLGAETMRTLWTFVRRSVESGQQITGPLQIGSSRPSIFPATGHRWSLSLFVKTTFPTPHCTVPPLNNFPKNTTSIIVWLEDLVA